MDKNQIRSSIEETVRSLAVDKSAIELNPDEREELRKLLLEFADCFALNPNRPTTTTVVTHEIETGSQRPIKMKPYNVPKAWEDKLKSMIDDMRANDIISPTSTSPWGFPVVLITKKDGSIRFCVDYRKLNAVTKTSSYPIPLISELLDSINGAKYFSSMDLASGYWQIKMNPNSVEKTTFVSKYGSFMFNVMPFGLVGAPATFQSLMDRIFGDLQWKSICFYFDDIFVFSRTFQDHLAHLREVFTRLRKYQLQAKLSKCQFLRKELVFLGYQVTQNGIKPNPERVERVKNWATPRRGKDVRSFIGLCSYYRRFVPHFASLAEPLHRLMGKNAEFKWSPETELSFNTLKEKLTTSPILSAPDWSQSFELHTDASVYGLGAVLSQRINDEEKVIAYASKSLNKAQQNYTVSDRECLAIIWGIRHYRSYLLGKKFELFTDHSALQFINTMRLNRDLSGRLARYQMFLQEYEFEPHYRKGELNANADALSRDPAFEMQSINLINVNSESHPGMPPREQSVYLSELPTTEEMIQLQQLDAELGPIIRELAGQSENDSSTSLAQRIISKSAVATGKYVFNQNGLLVRSRIFNYEKHEAVVIPEKMKAIILHHSHSDVFSAHLGIHKTYEKMVTKYFWNGMFKDVQNLILSCPHCNRRKSPKSSPILPALPMIPQGEPWSDISFDALGPLPKTTGGNLHIVVFMDRLTKYCELFAVPDLKETTVADLIVNEIVPRYGCPRTILSDGARSFNSELLQQVFVLLNSRKITTSPYNPQHNGQVERFNHTLVQMLTAYVKKNQKDWDRYLGLVKGAYHSCPQASTGYSPNYLTFGRELKLPLEIILSNREHYENLDDYFSNLLKRTSFAQDLARARLTDRAIKLEEQQFEAIQKIDYEIGEKIFIFTPDSKQKISNKLRSRWHGPFTVESRVSPVNYRVTRRLENGIIETRLINVRRMKLYTEPSPLSIESQRLAAIPINEEEDSDEMEFDVEEIRGKKIHEGIAYYLVKWAGYDENENTWEPVSNLTNSREYVNEFEAKRKKNSAKRRK